MKPDLGMVLEEEDVEVLAFNHHGKGIYENKGVIIYIKHKMRVFLFSMLYK